MIIRSSRVRFNFGGQTIEFVRGLEEVTLTITNDETGEVNHHRHPNLHRCSLTMRSTTLLACLTSVALSGCSSIGKDGRDTLPETSSLAFIPPRTQTQNMLAQIPPPQRPIAIAVYGFTDQTGQFKPGESGQQTLSRAVTQGAGSILVKALQDTGNRQWFTIVERESLR